MLLWNTHYINKQEWASTAYHVSHMSNATGRMIVERIRAIPRSGQSGKTVATRQSSLVKSVPSSWYTHNLWWLRKLLVASGGCIRAYVLICFWSGVVSAGAHNPGYTAGTFLPRPWPVNTRQFLNGAQRNTWNLLPLVPTLMMVTVYERYHSPCPPKILLVVLPLQHRCWRPPSAVAVVSTVSGSGLGMGLVGTWEWGQLDTTGIEQAVTPHDDLITIPTASI